jgi:APA family basic amino acid/polyamine antiporter
MQNAQRPHLLGFWTCVPLVGDTIGSGVFLLPASLAPYGLNSVVGAPVYFLVRDKTVTV